MEDLNKEITEEVKKDYKESPEEFKRRIDNTFTEFGLDLAKIPEDLSPEKFYKWKEERCEETDRPGTTIEEKVIFRMELAYCYILLSENEQYAELAWNELEDASQMAEYNKLEELFGKIKTLISTLENKDDQE